MTCLDPCVLGKSTLKATFPATTSACPRLPHGTFFQPSADNTTITAITFESRAVTPEGFDTFQNLCMGQITKKVYLEVNQTFGNRTQLLNSSYSIDLNCVW